MHASRCQHVQILAQAGSADRKRLSAAGQRLREADRLTQANQPEPALQIYLELAKLQRQLLGDKDPEFAATLNNIAALYKARGDYDRAERCYRQAVAIKKRSGAN